MGDHIFVVLGIMLLRMFGLGRRTARSVLVSGIGASSGAGALFSWHARRFRAPFPACGRGEAPGDTKHRRGRCYGPSKLIATAGRSICSFEWLLFRKFVLAVVKNFAFLRAVQLARAARSFANYLSRVGLAEGGRVDALRRVWCDELRASIG
jgi:hypothetical protein